MTLPEMPLVAGSRKITGLCITLTALLVLLIIAIAAVALFGVAESLFAQVAGFIATIGGAHQAGQALQDRAQAYSPNYPTPLAPPRDPGSLT